MYSIINNCFEKMVPDEQIIFHLINERTRLHPESIDSIQKFCHKKQDFPEFFYCIKITKNVKRNKLDGAKIII